MMEISKKYTAAEIEDKWYERWITAGAFRSVPDEREPYTIAIPPPNVTGILHMGHILNNTLQDVLIRRKRMLGYNACWVPGTDHASIATEAKVVKMLADQGISKQDISREAFLEHAFAWKEKYGGIILQQLRKLGASCDWERTAFTMDPEYSESVIKVFCDLHEKGLIYRGIRMVNWDPAAQTAVSDEEVIYRDTPGKLYHLRYPIEGAKEEYIVIATTRPETILGDTAVAVNPTDPRYQHLHGKRALVPLLNRSIPIITDDYVDKDFGTGGLKVTPAHDLNDYEIGMRHNLDVIDVFNDDGTISWEGERYVGQDRFAVRKQIVRDLDAAGLLVKAEDYLHSVGYSERTDVAIEPKLSMQWFLKMEYISKPALQAVLDGEVNLIPGKFVNTYKHWMENVRDWCLSRQLWWGHQIPAYYIKGTNQYVVAPTAEEALEKARDLTGREELHLEDIEQDADVLDTWASSWLWPISIFNGLTRPGNPDIAYYSPTNDLVTAPEILFFWVARMMIAGFEYMGKKPFTNVYLTGIVRDDLRRKMSKQLGNSPDPLDLIAQYGADGVRVGMLLASPAGNDLLYKESLVEQGRNFANKIWQAYRLVKSWLVVPAPPTDLDTLACNWMDARIDEVAAEIADHFEKFRISDALMSVYKLKWDDFCAQFLEMIKPGKDLPVAQDTYERVLNAFEKTLQLGHAFMPFITEEIWQGLREREPGAFLTSSRLFEPGAPDKQLIADMTLMQEAVSALRKFRIDKQIPQREPIALYIRTTKPERFVPYTRLLEKFLNTGKIEFVAEAVDGAARIQVGKHELFVPIKSVDAEGEREKILKDIAYLEGFLNSVMKKLGNERFVASAPAEVVETERKKKADAETKLALLRAALEGLGD